jgi:hypothetical protein
MKFFRRKGAKRGAKNELPRKILEKKRPGKPSLGIQVDKAP